jgi:outer membrane immunogenic protein
MLFVPVAHAADMALKAPSPTPAPIWSWTGFYIGANAGGGWAGTDWLHSHIDTCSAGFTVSGCDVGGQSSSSFIAGGQFGARWQTGQWVVGIEATADYANFHAITLDPQGAGAGFTIFDDTRLSGYTITGQAGVAWDRSLWYFKGGWASSWLTQTSNEPSVPTFGSVSHRANGWTVGTGLEYRLTSLPNFSVGLEYDYIRLKAGDTSTCTMPSGTSVFSCPALTTALMFTGFRADINEILVRGNYTFNWVGAY